MNILITNIWLVNHAGTEVYVRDLAIALSGRGIHVEVYSPELGVVADEIRNAGIHITDSTDELVSIPDLIHAHHFIPTMDAIIRFPDVPVVYFLHDRRNPVDTPPKHRNIIKYVAVDYNCLDRLIIDNGIPEPSTAVLYNFVDVSRFNLREIFRDKPIKALVFSNTATQQNYFRTIKDTCLSLGIKTDGIGFNLRNSVRNPEQVLHDYDIVFAKAKAAMEALSTGAGVIVCDILGMAGMVTVENFEYFRKYNFGMKTLTRPIDPKLIIQEIEKYNVQDIKVAARMIREDAAMGPYLDKLLLLYNSVINEFFQTRKANICFDNERTIQEYLFQKTRIFQNTKYHLHLRKMERQKRIKRLADNIRTYEYLWSLRLIRLILEPERLLRKMINAIKRIF